MTGSAGGLRIGALEAGPGNPTVMAVVNLSRDSFYTSAADAEAAVAQAEEAAAAGAGIVDIGGVRAGRGPEVTPAQEIDLICPVIEAIRTRLPDLVVSADTYRAETAEAALAAGAGILNDTWAGSDPGLPELAAAAGAGFVCSHTGGLRPRTDAHRSRYGLLPDDVVDIVTAALADSAARAQAGGIPAERILLDPTPDFGKGTRQSLALIREISRFASLGSPVLLAISRKDFVGEATGVAAPEGRLAGTLAATAYAVEHGVSVIRAHDVAATADVIAMIGAITGAREPTRSVRGVI